MWLIGGDVSLFMIGAYISYIDLLWFALVSEKRIGLVAVVVVGRTPSPEQGHLD